MRRFEARPYAKNAQGMYECPVCHEQFKTPQAVGIHRRHDHTPPRALAAHPPNRRSKGRETALPPPSSKLRLMAAILTHPVFRQSDNQTIGEVFQAILEQMTSV